MIWPFEHLQVSCQAPDQQLKAQEWDQQEAFLHIIAFFSDSWVLCSQKREKNSRARRLFLKLSASSCRSALSWHLAWHTFWQRWGLTNERTPSPTLNVHVTNEVKCWGDAPMALIVRWNPLKTPDLHKLVAYHETLGGTSSWLARNESTKESHVWIRSQNKKNTLAENWWNPNKACTSVNRMALYLFSTATWQIITKQNTLSEIFKQHRFIIFGFLWSEVQVQCSWIL